MGRRLVLVALAGLLTLALSACGPVRCVAGWCVLRSPGR
jgi:hypothetical protein